MRRTDRTLERVGEHKMTDPSWTDEHFALESLTHAYSVIQTRLTDLYLSACDSGDVSTLPGPGCLAPFDLWRTIGRALRADADTARVATWLPETDLVGARRSLGRCMQPVLDTASVDAGAARVIAAMCAGHPESYTADEHPALFGPVGDAWIAAHEPVPRVICMRRFTSDLYHTFWLALVRGTISRYLTPTAEHESALIHLETQLSFALERALRTRDETAVLYIDVPPRQFMLTIEIIRRRLSMIPIAAELGVQLPDDPEALAIIAAMTAQAEDASIAHEEAAANRVDSVQD